MTGMKTTSDDLMAVCSSSSSRIATASNVDVVVGLDDDLLEIKSQLCGESSRLQVIPIVGMGGIGKTTLARKAYNDQCVREFFDICGWVAISQLFSVEGIMACLQDSLRLESELDIDELISNEKKEKQEESPELKVYKALKGRKYLIVLDDIWNTQVWDRIRTYFPNDGNGSRIMLTTRLLDVATYPGGCNPYNMHLMPEDQSWDLLRHKVFTNEIHHHRQKLEDIGKAIARSCGGLPLAIVAIAGMLSTVEMTEDSWEEIAEIVNTKVCAKGGQLEKILSLSYTHLPRHLRQCFVYMGGFPEDSKIPVAKLVKLWIAEGFVDGGSTSLEEEAEECLKDLIKRSLVMVGERKLDGEIKSCSLHDMMRDLCRTKANEDKFPLYLDLTIAENFICQDVGYLRVMDWNPAGKILNLSIKKRIFGTPSLRYVVLPDNVTVATDISCLANLQTLISYEGLLKLPPQIWRMQELRHIKGLLDGLPCPQGATSSPLENLQTLSRVRNQECSYRFVKMIPNIRKLGLVYSTSHVYEHAYHSDILLGRNEVENWCDQSAKYDCCLKNLKWLRRLEKLKVMVHPGFQVILNPVFPPSLKKLSFSGWRLPAWTDMTILGSLPNLQVLKLRGFSWQDDTWETNEGEFNCLRFLLIERSNLRIWSTESGHFPNLKCLLIHYCCNLEEIPKDIGDIPTLELIEVKQGSTSLLMSATLIEEEQKNMNNDSLQVRCTGNTCIFQQ